jgi:TolB-like protein
MRIQFLVSMLVLSAAVCRAAAAVEDSTRRPVAVAVMDFEGRGVAADEALTLADRFRAELSACDGIRQVERSQMDAILREQGFQQSGCVSTECAVQTGRLLGVERMVSGSVSKIGETWTLHARLIDVGTAEILRTAIVDQRGAVDDVLTRGMAQLAARLAGTCKAAVASAAEPGPLPLLPPPKPILPVAIREDIASSIQPEPMSDASGAVPFQLSLVSPVSLPRGDKVNGLAVDVFYGHLVGMRGIQAGLINHVEGETRGIQGGAINISGDFRGVQGGAFNLSDDLRGIQGGVVNMSNTSKGMQAGLVNITGKCTCVQFGLINIWKTPDGATWIFPIIGGIH